MNAPRSRTAFVSTIILLVSVAAMAQDTGTAANTEPAPKHCTLAADDIAIRKIAQDFKDGYNNGDAAKVAALYTEDATYLTQHYATGIVQGRERIQAYIQKGVDAKYNIESIEVLSTTCSGEMAYALARYRSNNGGVKTFGVNLLVLRKRKTHWMIVAHEAAVPDPLNAIQTLDMPRK